MGQREVRGAGASMSAWHEFTVDGETYYWTAYRSMHRIDKGPWEPMEFLTVSRRADAPGVGEVLPVGTTVTEQHAAALVRRFKSAGRDIP